MANHNLTAAFEEHLSVIRELAAAELALNAERERHMALVAKDRADERERAAWVAEEWAASSARRDKELQQARDMVAEMRKLNEAMRENHNIAIDALKKRIEIRATLLNEDDV